MHQWTLINPIFDSCKAHAITIVLLRKDLWVAAEQAMPLTYAAVADKLPRRGMQSCTW